jgi:porin
MWVRRIGFAVTATLLGCLNAEPSLAQATGGGPPLPGAPAQQQSPPGGPIAAPAPAGAAGPGFWTGLFAPSRSNLLGDMGGLRTTLGNYGVSLGLQELSEVLGNVTGGVRRGFDYDGLTEMSLGIDTAKAFGWEGGTFNVSALQIHGRDLSTDNLLSLQTASGIEAERATRLWELWYQQAFLSGAVDVKIGQQSIDQEFIVSQYAGTFVNTAFGWPTLPSFDLYAGGPAYPLSSLGVRLRAHPTDDITVLAGVFDDNPGGGPFSADGQRLDASGTTFNLNTGALWIAELQYALNQPAVGQLTRPNQPTGLPGTYKLGFWYDSGHLPDQLFDTLGLPLSAAASSGAARPHDGNYSIYAVVDQLVWRPGPTSGEGIGMFARVMGAPESDRNLITMSANAGLTWRGALPGRDNDTFGLGMGFAKVSSRAAALDRAAGLPARTGETYLELTYQYQVAPWWTLQPDVQYVFNPGGGILNPVNPTKKVGDEAIVGIRTTIAF